MIKKKSHKYVFRRNLNMAKFSWRVIIRKITHIFLWTTSNYCIKFLFHYQPAITTTPILFSLTTNLLWASLSIFADHSTDLPIQKSIQVYTDTESNWSGPTAKGFPVEGSPHSPAPPKHCSPSNGNLLSNQGSMADGTSKDTQWEAEWLFLVLTAELLFFQAQLTFI